MSDQQKDTFVGKHQQVAVKDGFFTKVGISKADFDKFSENGWLNLKINKAKDGRSFLILDTWKPDPNYRKNQPVIENTNPLPSKKLSTEQEWSDKVNGNDSSLPF